MSLKIVQYGITRATLGLLVQVSLVFFIVTQKKKKMLWRFLFGNYRHEFPITQIQEQESTEMIYVIKSN